MAVLIVASVVLLSWSIMFGREQTWLNRTDTRWLLSLQSVLLILAFQSPNPLIGIIIAWIAIHPWIAHLGFSYGPLRFAPDQSSVYQPLFPILWWSTIYITFSHINQQYLYIIIPSSIIAWGIINCIIAFWQDHTKSFPVWLVDHRTPDFPNAAGLVGSSYFLSFLCSAGVVSAAFLLYYTHQLLLLIPLVLLIYFSYRSGTTSPLASAVVTLLLFASTVYMVTYLVLIPVFTLTYILAKLSNSHISSFQSRIPAWKVAWQVSVSTYFIGIGLGMWNAITNPPDPNERSGIIWRNLHNDWLQSLVELSPVPVLCSIVLLTSQWMYTFQTSPIHQGQLYGLLMATYISVYAVVYFPLRDNMPAFLLAVSLSMMDH